eukprot:g13437.t1
MASVFTCTACAVSFSTSEAHKAHYKLDWHRYNLRRKVAGLAPVDQGDFDRRLAAALGTNAPKAEFKAVCKVCRKSFRSEGLYNQHLRSKKHKEAVKRAEAAEAAALAKAEASVSMIANTAGGGATAAAVAVAEHAAAAAAAAGATAARSPSYSNAVIGSDRSSMEVESAEEMEEEEEEELAPPPMGSCVCIFCDFVSPSFEDNCAHMLKQHGFFIPDVEYLKDPQGLVAYVEEKVKLGHICPYCNGKGKTFHTYRSLQQHMTDRSHCKLLYNEDEDLHEYEAFYDFSASYSDAERLALNAVNVSSSSDVAAAAEADGGEGSDDEAVELSRTLGVTDLGELVLLDGRTVGNRKWNRYYKQRLRTADEREVTVAHRRAAQLRLGAMYDTEMRKGMSTGGAVVLQRGERKAFGGLSGVSRPKDVKMLRAHQRSQARERLNTQIKQNKLNKTFDRIMDM